MNDKWTKEENNMLWNAAYLASLTGYRANSYFPAKGVDDAGSLSIACGDDANAFLAAVKARREG